MEEKTIRVGDEVVNHHGTTAKVLKIDGDQCYVMWAGMETKQAYLSIWSMRYDVWKKTGKHFDDIEEILNQMIR